MLFDFLFRILTGQPAPNTPDALRRSTLWRLWFALQVGLCLAISVFALATIFEGVGKVSPGFDLNHRLTTTPFAKGVPPLTRVVAVNGEPIGSSEALLSRVQAAPAGTPFRYHFLGHPEPITVRSERVERIPAAFWPAWIPGVAHFLVGLAILWLAPLHPAARAHWFFCLALGYTLLANYTDPSNVVLDYGWYPAVALVVASTAALGVELPAPITGRRRRILLGLGWGLTALLVAGYAAACFLPALWPLMHQAHMLAPSIALVAFLLHCVGVALSRRQAPIDRARARTIVAGLFVALMTPIAGYFLYTTWGQQLPWLNQTVLHASFGAAGFFPLAIGYAIVRHQLFDITFIIRRATLYTGVTAGLAALYALCVALGHAFTGVAHGVGVTEVAAAIAVALAFQPLYRTLRRRIDRFFLGERADALDTLESFSRRLPRDPRAVADELVALLMRALKPTGLRLSFGDTVLAEAGSSPGADALVVPLEAGGQLRGELALGPLASEMPYTRHDRALVALLARQVAAALENARLFEAQVALAAEEALARRLAEERRELLQQVVHDIRSDLFNIQLATARLKPRLDDARPAESIERSISRIDALLGEKTRWLQSGRESTVARAPDALATVRSAIEPLLDTKHQRLDLAIATCEAPLALSEVELTQVLMNLLTNAHKFSPAHSVIRLSAEREANHLVLAVEDQGPGLPPDLLADPTLGRRADPSVPGSGLGLQNTRALIERAGGSLSWQNLASGCRFEVRLPLQEEQEEQEETAPATEGRSAARS